MYFFPLAMLLGAPLGWADFARNIAPVIAGNIVGGSMLVALVYYVIYMRPTRLGIQPRPGSADQDSTAG
jgi:formate transporter